MKFSKFFLYLLVVVVLLGVGFYSKIEEKSLFSTILGVSTFIFGTFVAFSISDRRSRIDKIRECDSAERAQLYLIYLMAGRLGGDFQEKVRSKIDEYLMATLDYKIWDYHLTNKQYAELLETVSTIEFTGEKNKAYFSQMLSAIKDIGISRKQTIGLIGERLSKFEWWILVFLTVVIVVSLVSVNSGTVASILIIGFLALSVSLIMWLLFMLDSLTWKEEERIFEPYAKTFEAVGLVRYYPEALISQNRVVGNKGKQYRVGRFPNNYPNMTGKTIELVNN